MLLIAIRTQTKFCNVILRNVSHNGFLRLDSLHAYPYQYPFEIFLAGFSH